MYSPWKTFNVVKVGPWTLLKACFTGLYDCSRWLRGFGIKQAQGESIVIYKYKGCTNISKKWKGKNQPRDDHWMCRINKFELQFRGKKSTKRSAPLVRSSSLLVLCVRFLVFLVPPPIRRRTHRAWQTGARWKHWFL